MLSAIGFAIKMVVAVAYIVVLSFGRSRVIPRDQVGIYSLLSITIATITVISQELNSGLLISSVFLVISIISYNNFQKDNDLIRTLKKISLLWISTALGMCAGAWMLLQGAFLAFITYYILNYFSTLVSDDDNTKN